MTPIKISNYLSMPCRGVYALLLSAKFLPSVESIRRRLFTLCMQITEEQLAVFFKSCGDIMDCRVCGDPNSAMRFAFVEFTTSQAALQVALITDLLLTGKPSHWQT